VYPALERYIQTAWSDRGEIPEERQRLLDEVAAFVSTKRRSGEIAELTFICTHNSRRSQMGQVWAATAAAHHGIDRLRAYSGGTEVTVFNPRAVATMRRAGFAIESPGGANPHHLVKFAEGGPAMECFSKTYDDPTNPGEGFAAIMTCSEAEEACPVVFGAALRVPLRYEDPKVADGTSEEAAVYDERCLQIATEMLYLFSRVA
jgi:arsenate reductase